jgi:signal transduction histidine kinase
MTRRRARIVYLVAWLLALGGTLRYLEYILGHPSRWVILGLLAAFFVLLAIAPWLARRSQRYMHLYLAVQTSILVASTIATTIEDFAALPFMSLLLIAMTIFPPKIGFRWIGVFVVTLIVSMIAYGIMYRGINAWMILLTALVYITVYLFVGAFMAVIRQLETARSEAEVARRKSEELLAELQQEVDQRLQVEEALRISEMEKAVTEERSRLARELHDSVTQSLYSLTLFTEAARQTAEDAGYERIERQIGQIGRIGLQALKEMRLLVYELRPPELKQEGLVSALRQRLEAVEGRAGVEARVIVDVDEFGRLPRSVELGLYRIAQEALNNALKHAAATSVVVRLRKADGRVELEVVDDGLGFQPEAVRDRGGMGLESICQRAEGLGGTATIRSAPGEGTSVKVTVDLEEEPHE